MCPVCQGRVGCPVCAPESVKCPECNGRGRIRYRGTIQDCDVCDGTGEIEIDEENE
jgi:hypothetical protein